MIVITLGDPHSINVEILSKHLGRITRKCVLIGSYWQWLDQCTRLKIDSPRFAFAKNLDECGAIDAPRIFIDIAGHEAALEVSAEILDVKGRGTIASRALQKLKGPSLANVAIVTAPIDKYACHAGGFQYPGQTEFFESIAGEVATMLLAGSRLRVGLVTNHLALGLVSENISSELIIAKIKKLSLALTAIFDISQPRIAVCGLNPHCGDLGLFGNEEEIHIRPAVLHCNQLLTHCRVFGPFPADTVFFEAVTGKYDAVLAMYHDQGLGPLKTIHFFDAVNISAGLPFLRVAPDHGPAKGLFLQGNANCESMSNAIDLAEHYLDRRQGS